MKVALDSQLAVGTATGIGVFVRDLAGALAASEIEVCRLQAPRLDPWRFDRRVLWDQVLLPLQAQRSGATLLHAAAGTMPLLVRLPTLVTVHDLAWLRVQAHTRAYARGYFGGLMRRLYPRALAVVTDSAFTRDEYLTLIGAHAELHVVHPGVDARFGALVRAPHERPLLLVVGTIERRKNLALAVEAVAAFPEVELVAIGPLTPYADEVRARIAALGIGARVTLRGYVEREERDALYASATAALVPSRYEGFGYALAEALCAGLPVIAARSSSLVEIAGSELPLLDPDDVAAWRGALAALLADPAGAEARAAALRSGALARFGWERAAAQYAALYRRISH